MIRASVVFAVVVCVALAASAGTKSNEKTASKPRSSPKGPARAQAAKGNVPDDAETVNPGVFLLRDPLVQSELRLSPEQKSAAAGLAAEFNEPIWSFRDASIHSEAAVREAHKLNALIEPRLEGLLTAGQRERLAGIILQLQGASALQLGTTAQRLSLAREQRTKISKIVSTAHAAAAKRPDADGDLGERNRRLEAIQGDLERDLLEVLTAEQRKRWTELRGAPIELTKLQPLAAQAPELRGVTDWINSAPLTLKELRGKVVALHFWTFG